MVTFGTNISRISCLRRPNLPFGETGVGGQACGPKPLKTYIYWTKPVERWTYRILPVTQ